MMTTVELRDGKLLLSPAIIKGFGLEDGDLVEVALLRAFRRGGRVIEMEPEAAPAKRAEGEASLKARDGDWSDIKWG